MDTGTVKVWDPFVRVFHWTLVAGFLVAFLTEDDLMTLHAWAGYLVLCLVGLRVLWGLIGTRFARFSDFLSRPSTVVEYLKDVAAFRARRYLGHNPAGGAMIVVLLVLLVLTGLTGLAVYGAEESAGPLADFMRGTPGYLGDALEELHEFVANLTLLCVLLHVLGVLVASLQHRENLVRSMFTGLKRREEG
jgi:cytochrome b